MPDHVTAGYGGRRKQADLAVAALKIELLKDEVLALKREVIRLRQALRRKVAA